MRSISEGLALALALTLGAGPARAAETKVPLDKLPKVVTEAVKKMFPKAELVEATEEKEDDEVEYEVTIHEAGKKIDVTVEADGEIETLEKQVDVKDLPKKVLETVEKVFPKALHQSAEGVYEIEDGKEELEYYELQLKTAGDQQLEVKVYQGGKIVIEPHDED